MTAARQYITEPGPLVDLTIPAHFSASPAAPRSPAPTGIEAMVCRDIAERQRMGVAKYGTTLAAAPLSQRDVLQHAYEEALDLANYLKRTIVAIDAGIPPASACSLPERTLP